MSLLAVQGGATGTGTVTLLAPVTNTNRTLTLPDATGTVLTNATTTGFPAGSVLQVVNATTTSSTSTTSSSFVTTSFSVSITPTSASSKILVMMSGGNFDNNSASNAAIFASFYRNNSTNLGSTSGISMLKSVTARLLASGSLLVFDSPATTSATTYTLYIASESGQSVAFNNSGGLLATLIAMEIAA